MRGDRRALPAVRGAGAPHGLSRVGSVRRARWPLRCGDGCASACCARAVTVCRFVTGGWGGGGIGAPWRRSPAHHRRIRAIPESRRRPECSTFESPAVRLPENRAAGGDLPRFAAWTGGARRRSRGSPAPSVAWLTRVSCAGPDWAAGRSASPGTHGSLHRCLPRVYLVGHTARARCAARAARAALRSGGRGRSAIAPRPRIWGISNCLPSAGRAITVIVAAASAQRPRASGPPRRDARPRATSACRHGLPVTAPARTLHRPGRRASTPTRARAALAEARVQRLVTRPRARTTAMERGPGREGRRRPPEAAEQPSTSRP